MRILRLAGTATTIWLAVVGTVRAQGNASPVPSVAVPPAPSASPSATPDAARRRAAEKAMTERRQRDLAASVQETQKRIEQLPVEEREAFKRNLSVWRELSPEERVAVRQEAEDRMRAEIEKAYQESGLHLDKDRREVFALRYRQERRKLERELQAKLEAERAHHLPGIIDGLKREFADKAATPTPSAVVTPSVSVPAASPGR